MNTIINLRIPHVGEQIFKNIDTENLIQCVQVSEAWKVLAGNVLFPRIKGKLFEACGDGKTELVRIILAHPSSRAIDLNATGRYLREIDSIFCEFRIGTAFSFACHNGHKEIVKLLLDHPNSQDIDFNDMNAGGDTAFALACDNGHKDVGRNTFLSNYVLNFVPLFCTG